MITIRNQKNIYCIFSLLFIIFLVDAVGKIPLFLHNNLFKIKFCQINNIKQSVVIYFKINTVLFSLKRNV